MVGLEVIGWAWSIGALSPWSSISAVKILYKMFKKQSKYYSIKSSAISLAAMLGLITTNAQI